MRFQGLGKGLGGAEDAAFRDSRVDSLALCGHFSESSGSGWPLSGFQRSLGGCGGILPENVSGSVRRVQKSLRRYQGLMKLKRFKVFLRTFNGLLGRFQSRACSKRFGTVVQAWICTKGS